MSASTIIATTSLILLFTALPLSIIMVSFRVPVLRHVVSAAAPYLRAPPIPQIPTEKSSTPGIKTLSSYLDLEKTRELPHKELEAIWRLRHVNDPQSLCAVIPLDVYKTIEATAKKHPHFVLPLPKEEHG